MQPPRIAIIDSNTLQAMGLKSIFSDLVPMAEVCTYISCDEMEQDGTDGFFHFFVSVNSILERIEFFRANLHKTIVLTTQQSNSPLLDNFRTLNIQQPENMLIHTVLKLFAVGHKHMKNIPTDLPPFNKMGGGMRPSAEPISQREAEVLALVAQGLINKEIADRLNISLTTVVTHRKNITEKLQIKSVSALTIYAVTHGLVSIDDI
ncbi:MAG: helix-turn-helix transcriptional regulator [Bacteroidaceae bacterium]|nr:helix-turn-helix transcriptional regulator [Bacteroidaceae bacterium]